MNINSQTILVSFCRKMVRCRVCDTQLKNQSAVTKRHRRYCIPCAVLKKVVTRKELRENGYRPPREQFERALERKKMLLQTRKKRVNV